MAAMLQNGVGQEVPGLVCILSCLLFLQYLLIFHDPTPSDFY